MLFDLSPLITPALCVWPGDTPPSREVLLDLRRGDTVTLSTLRATVHLGAHADAPSHYAADAPSIEARALDYYLGPCQVVRVAAARGSRVTAAMVATLITEPRVLLATGSFPDPECFTTDFAAFDPALIEAWARLGVRLVGIDTPSVDVCDSEDLP